MENINKHIEHTLLKQDATKTDLIKLFEEARENKFLGVCVNPCYVSLAKEYLKDSDVKIVTVIGFPLGANTTEVKVFETQKAVNDGADEIDMVINVTKVKDKDKNFVVNEIKEIKKACNGHNLKVIIETDLLTKEEIVESCKYSIEGGADFVKTSTGFVKNGIGAKAEDVELMYKTVKDAGLKVKASGGIRDRQTAIDMLNAGAERLGTSSGVKIINGQK
jgi:deoxyribose-phosphate aldolase